MKKYEKQAQEDIFKPPFNKNWLPKNPHHTVETFIGSPSTEIDVEKAKCKNTTFKFT